MIQYDFYISNKELASQSKDCLRGSWGTASAAAAIVFFMCLIPLAITVLLSLFVYWWLTIPLGLLTLFIWAIMSYGFSNMCLKISKQEIPIKKDVFAGFSRKMGHIIKIVIKRLFASIFWLILLIIPCVIKNIGYSMAFMLLADRSDIKSDNALKESAHIMQQNHGRYLKLIFKNTLWYLLILVSAGFAWFWVGPLLRTRKALFYENLKTEF